MPPFALSASLAEESAATLVQSCAAIAVFTASSVVSVIPPTFDVFSVTKRYPIPDALAVESDAEYTLLIVQFMDAALTQVAHATAPSMITSFFIFVFLF